MVKLYTIDCTKCKILKEKLDSVGIEYEVINDRKTLIEMGLDELPVLESSGKMMDFLDACEYIKYLGR
jgi:arsenate reductase-like glutaredoxin family protein